MSWFPAQKTAMLMSSGDGATFSLRSWSGLPLFGNSTKFGFSCDLLKLRVFARCCDFSFYSF